MISCDRESREPCEISIGCLAETPFQKRCRVSEAEGSVIVFDVVTGQKLINFLYLTIRPIVEIFEPRQDYACQSPQIRNHQRL